MRLVEAITAGNPADAAKAMHEDIAWGAHFYRG